MELNEQEAGNFYGEYQTTITGVYHCRFLAYGNTLEGDKFTREQNRTATTYRHVPAPSAPTDGDDDSKSIICRIIDCFLKEQNFQELLKRYKIDPASIHKCFSEACKSNKRLNLIQGINIMKKEIDKQPGSRELSSNLAQRIAPLLRETGMLKVNETPEPKKVKAAPEQEIPMNPLGGMWPVVETKKGEFQILLKTDKGKLDPPPASWKEDKEDKKEPRKIMLSDALLNRIKNVSKKGKSNKRK